MISVRGFDAGDASALAVLMREMVAFYGATIDPTALVEEEIVRQAKQMTIIVAHQDDALLGFATFASLYPVAGLRAFTYVQQVYVRHQARRLGVAQKLMAEIAHATKAAGNTRMEWSTGRDNAVARAFYDGLGADGSDKIYYVLEGPALERLAAQQQLPNDGVQETTEPRHDAPAAAHAGRETSDRV